MRELSWVWGALGAALLQGCLGSLPASHVGFRCDTDALCDASSTCVGSICRAGGPVPQASNTGVPPGAQLTASSGVIVTTPGAQLDGLDIQGCVRISASNVTLRRSRVRCQSTNGVFIDDGVLGTTLEDVEVDGQGVAQRALVGSSFTARRLHLHSVYIAVEVGSDVTLADSYIHDLTGTGGNGVFTLQGSGVTLNNDHIDVADSATACVLASAQAGDISHLVVENCLLNGGGFTLSFGQQGTFVTTDFKVTGNRFGRGSGYGLLNGAGPSVTLSANVWDDTGLPVPTP